MKWNWGTKLFLVYSFFILAMSFLVYKTLQQDYEMVTDDYYGKELQYQHVINGKNNAAALSGRVQVLVSGAGVAVALPAGAPFDSGTVHFYKPDGRRHDVILPLAGPQLQVDGQKLAKGAYKVITAWVGNGKDYYAEEDIMIQ